MGKPAGFCWRNDSNLSLAICVRHMVAASLTLAPVRARSLKAARCRVPWRQCLRNLSTSCCDHAAWPVLLVCAFLIPRLGSVSMALSTFACAKISRQHLRLALAGLGSSVARSAAMCFSRRPLTGMYGKGRGAGQGRTRLCVVKDSVSPDQRCRRWPAAPPELLSGATGRWSGIRAIAVVRAAAIRR